MTADSMGELMMPEGRVFVESVARWGESWLNITLLIVTMALFVLFFNTLSYYINATLPIIRNYRINRQIERNVRLSHSRSIILVVLTLGFSLTADCQSLFGTGFPSIVPPSFSILGVLGMMLAFFLLKFILNRLALVSSHKKDTIRSAYAASLNYMVITLLLLTMICTVASLCKLSLVVTRIIVLFAFTCTSMVSFVGEMEILSASYQRFLSFLYLCTFELIPMAAFAAGVILL